MCALMKREVSVAVVSFLLWATAVQAQEGVAQPPPPPAAPYSMPWGLRGAVPANVARLDTVYAPSDTPVETSTLVSLALLSYKLSDNLAILGRFGGVRFAPEGVDSKTVFTNPVVGAMYSLKIDALRITGFLGLALPLGTGGGNISNPGPLLRKAAITSGMPARAAMDNAMFAVNDLTVFPGVDLVYAARGLSVQAEATVLQLMRARGDKVQPDTSKTNLTMGLHAGYFLHPVVSVGAELRYQRWLAAPKAIKALPDNAAMDNLTFALGPRFHIEIARGVVARPGVSFGMPLDAPMKDAGYTLWQLDLPVSF